MDLHGLDVVASVSFHLLNLNMATEMSIIIQHNTPITPKIFAFFAWLECLCMSTTVKCGGWSEGWSDRLLHVDKVKERHKFPDVLGKQNWIRFHRKNWIKNNLRKTYLTCRFSLFKDCGKTPSSLLFSKFLYKKRKF